MAVSIRLALARAVADAKTLSVRNIGFPQYARAKDEQAEALNRLLETDFEELIEQLVDVVQDTLQHDRDRRVLRGKFKGVLLRGGLPL